MSWTIAVLVVIGLEWRVAFFTQPWHSKTNSRGRGGEGGDGGNGGTLSLKKVIQNIPLDPPPPFIFTRPALLLERIRYMESWDLAYFLQSFPVNLKNYLIPPLNSLSLKLYCMLWLMLDEISFQNKKKFSSTCLFQRRTVSLVWLYQNIIINCCSKFYLGQKYVFWTS